MTRDGKEGPSDISHIIENPVCTFDQDDADRVFGMRSRSDISQSISNLVKSSRMKSDPSISSKSRSKGGPSSPRPRSRAKPRSRSRARSRSRSRPSVMCKSRATENSRSRSASRSRRLVRTNSESSGSISRSKEKRATSRSRNVVRVKPGSESRIVRANSESSGSISRSKENRATSRSRNVVRVKPGSELRSSSRSRSQRHEDKRMTANSRPRSRSRSRPEMRANSRSNDEHSSRSRSTSRSRSKHRTDKKRWKHHPRGNRKPSREKKRWKHHPGKNLKGNDPLLKERKTKGNQETRSPVVTKRSPSHDIRDQKVGDACAPPLFLVNDVREQRSFGSRAQSISPISDLEGNDSSSEVAYSPSHIGDKKANSMGFWYHDELGRLDQGPRSSMTTVVSIFNAVLNCLGVCHELQTEVKQATSCSPQSDQDFVESPESDNGCMSPFSCGESGGTKSPSTVDQFDVNGRFGELFKNEGKWKPIKPDLDQKIEKIASDLEPFDDGEDSVLGGSDDLSDVAQNRAYGRGWWHLLRKGLR